jgi:flagellar basal body-associated protein FliL
MNLLLRPLDIPGDPVWSVIILVILAVVGALGYVIYILRMAFAELKDGSNDTPKQEVLLQLPSDKD